MSEDNKDCPFCGNLRGCRHFDQALIDGDCDGWNSRPIEDAMRERVEKAELKLRGQEILEEQARARIAELEAAWAWRPIETAPREERKPVLLYYGPGEFAIGAWWGFHEEFHSAGRPWDPQPTH